MIFVPSAGQKTPVLFMFLAVLFTAAYWGGIENLIFRWSQREEYSHGFFIPLISLWLLWQRRDAISQSIGCPSLLGVGCVLIALVLLWLGELSALFILIHVGLVMCLMGAVLVLGGWSLLQVCLLPLLFLLFAIPMPYFIDALLSWWLQLASSRVGVEMLRLFGVAVYLQGNVIDLGNYALQVVDACSGLRYLYPLSSLAFLAAYLFAAPLWQRVVVFLSVVPITVFMNSFRIAVIGVLVNLSGTFAAEGFLHFFEGWVIFMACALMLVLEIWLLDRLGSRRALRDLLVVPTVEPVPPSGGGWSAIPLALMSVLLLVSALGLHFVDGRKEIVPARLQFNRFPLALENWSGRESTLDEAVERALGISDYLLADYWRGSEEVVSFYVAYYGSQRKGLSPHSPRVCIPGGGWSITKFERMTVQNGNGSTFPANRAELQLNSQRQLVYYWFEQRGRRIANEYALKWHLLRDSIAMNRSDGALVRVSTVIRTGETVGSADERLRNFVKVAAPLLPDFVPGQGESVAYRIAQ